MEIKSKNLESFVKFVKEIKGADLESYRPSFILRRLKVRMDWWEIKDLSGYMVILENNPGEWDKLLETLSINVSEFFRDPQVFNFFYNNCLGKLIKEKRLMGQKVIRAWSAGCSFGEEAYSLAILLQEYIEGVDKEKFSYRILATDMDRTALGAASKGEYSKLCLKNVKPTLLNKYFIPTQNDKWVVGDELKKAVLFKQHNLFSPTPFKGIDIVLCRNVRIYFDTFQAVEVLQSLYSALNKGGYLMLGRVEVLPPSLRDAFIVVEGKYKIYQKKK